MFRKIFSHCRRSRIFNRLCYFCGDVRTIAFSEKYLLYTNIGLCMSLSGLGDLMQQHCRKVRGQSERVCLIRTRKMTLSAASMGVICHYWYLWLDRFLPGRTFRIIARKVILDQILLSPVMWVTYLFLLGLFEGRTSLQYFTTRLREQGGRLYAAEWIVWPPAQALNFYCLPTKYRVLYDNFVSLGFDWYSSYVLNDFDSSADDKYEIIDVLKNR